MARRAADIIAALRFRNSAGRLIQQHRALRRLDFEPASWLQPLMIAPLFGFLVALLANPITQAWGAILGFWCTALALPAEIVTETRSLLGLTSYQLIELKLSDALPEFGTWRGTLIAFSVIAIAAYVFARKHLAFVYIVFLHYLLILIGLGYFAFFPSVDFPHDITTHTRSGLEMSLMLILLVPWMLAPSLYVFDLPVLRKLAGTVMIIAGVALFAPLQYMLHAVIMHSGSLMFLPLLYVLYGLLINVLIFVSLYAWALSWEPRR